MTSHTERLQACLAGENTDRPPVALWRHFPVDDQTPGTLATATLKFQELYDFDLVKVTPSSSFCLRDWGVEDRWIGNSEGTRDYTKRVIHQPSDWRKLTLLDPKKGQLAEQIECVKGLRRELGSETPLLQTIFSPLAQAKNLAGGELMLAHLKNYPEELLVGLHIIAESTRSFIEACAESGVDGIFYAIQHAQSSLLSIEEYKSFGVPFDLTALYPTGNFWCNLLHIHGSGIYFSISEELSFNIVNWHDRETGPSLTIARNTFQGTLCGGMSTDTLVNGTPDQVIAEAREASEQTGNHKFMLGTGCVVPTIAPHENIQAARQAYETALH
jgi:uroporphyrinogen decarboxylase